MFLFFFSSRRRHTRSLCDWSSDVCSSDLEQFQLAYEGVSGVPSLLNNNVKNVILTRLDQLQNGTGAAPKTTAQGNVFQLRSEERRVGKECRCGWSPEHQKKKKRRERRRGR